MIRFQALGIRFCVPLVTLLMPFLAARLGMRGAAGALFLSLAVHELAHIAAAALLHVQLAEIRLLPFGGSARIENPYRLPAGRIIPTAAAGPAGNLLLVILGAALAQWSLVSAAFARKLMTTSLVLMLFNLMPALPLDGGRILYALLVRPAGERRALKLCITAGYLLAACLLICMVWGGLRSGVWNLSLGLAALFIFASAPDEQKALSQSQTERMLEYLHSGSSPRPVRILEVDERTSAAQALRMLERGAQHLFVLLRGGEPCALISGRSLLRQLIDGKAPDASLSELRTQRISIR